MKKRQNIPMRKLEELTGFSRTMISFYIKEGLLPAPQKSAKNMAYYGEEFIQRLQLIQKLKGADLSLAQIKQVLNSENNLIDINPLLNSMKSINKLLPLGSIDQPVKLEQIKEYGIEDEIINGLIKLSVIQPIDADGDLFSSDSITICQLAKYFFDFGIPLTVAKDILHDLHKIVDTETHAFNKYIIKSTNEGLTQEQQDALILECLENINTLLPLLHLQLMKSERRKRDKKSDHNK